MKYPVLGRDIPLGLHEVSPLGWGPLHLDSMKYFGNGWNNIAKIIIWKTQDWLINFWVGFEGNQFPQTTRLI